MLLRRHRIDLSVVWRNGVITRKCGTVHAKNETPREFFSLDLFVYPPSG